MSKAKKARKKAQPKAPLRVGYADVAAHHGVARRTVVRWVTRGQVPSPVTLGTFCFWEGDDAERVLQQPGFPGSYPYTPSERESKRAASAARLAKSKGRKRAKSSIRGAKQKASDQTAKEES